MTISRRALLKYSSAALAAAGLPGLARAQSGNLVVATWGGDYGQLLRDTIDLPLMEPAGVTVAQDVGAPDIRKAKMLAERNTSQGSIDVGCFDDTDAYLLHAQKLVQEINADRVPRYANLLGSLQTGYSVPHIHSPLAVIYNTEQMKTPPAGFNDFWDPANKGRVGLVDISYQFNYAMAAVAAGQGMSDYSAAEAKLRELRKLEPKIYPSVEALAAGLKSGEVWLGSMFMARGVMWQRAGIPVKAIFPEEGTISVAFHGVVAANSGNSDAAMKYADHLLDPKVQAAFAEKMGYNPTVTDATVPEELAAMIAITEEQQQKIVKVDHDYVARNLQQLVSFWDREMKG